MSNAISNNSAHIAQHLNDNNIKAFLDGDFNTITFPYVNITTNYNYQHLALNSYDNTINININFGENDKDFKMRVLDALKTYETIEHTGLFNLENDEPSEDSDTNTFTHILTIREIIQII